jgi:hypothetical protein
MPNRQLSKDEHQKADELLGRVRSELESLSAGDVKLLFAYRRKLYKKLMYDERGTPMERRKLKEQKWKEQKGKCAICGEDLPETEAELDRFEAYLRYTPENTRLIHHACHRKQQAERGFA